MINPTYIILFLRSKISNIILTNKIYFSNLLISSFLDLEEKSSLKDGLSHDLDSLDLIPLNHHLYKIN